MNNLEEEIYKTRIKKGEKENGYVVEYNPNKQISYLFKMREERFEIEEDGKIISAHYKYSLEEIKKICYDYTFEFLKNNTKIKLGIIWDKSAQVFKDTKGGIFRIDGSPEKVIDDVRNASYSQKF